MSSLRSTAAPVTYGLDASYSRFLVEATSG